MGYLVGLDLEVGKCRWVLPPVALDLVDLAAKQEHEEQEQAPTLISLSVYCIDVLQSIKAILSQRKFPKLQTWPWSSRSPTDPKASFFSENGSTEPERTSGWTTCRRLGNQGCAQTTCSGVIDRLCTLRTKPDTEPEAHIKWSWKRYSLNRNRGLLLEAPTLLGT